MKSKPVIYTDSIGQQVFSLLDMDCEIANVHDHLYEHADPSNFAISKLYTYKLLTPPFVYFDLDIILEQDFITPVINQDYDVVGFCAENVEITNNSVKHAGEFLYLSEEAKQKWQPVGPFYNRNQNNVNALNCCLLYINNQQFLEQYISESIECYTQNNHIPRSARANWDVVSEQQLLTNLLLDSNLKWSHFMSKWPVMLDDIHGLMKSFNDTTFKQCRSNKTFLMCNYYNTDVESAAKKLCELV